MNRYTGSGYWLLLENFICAAVTAYLFLFGGLSAYLQKLSTRFKNKNLGNLIYISLFLLLTYLLCFPLDFCQNFFREQYVFSNQNLLEWLKGDLLMFVVELMVAGPFFMIVYAIFRKVKPHWWIWGSGIAIMFMILAITIDPVFISPLFDAFKPIKNSLLRNLALAMAKANQVNVAEVHIYNEMKISKP